MKNMKSIILSGAFWVSAVALSTSCSDLLDLGPEDYYGSGNYWKNETQVAAYVDGIHKHLRDGIFQHTIVFGELRGGHYKSGLGCDGTSLGRSWGNVISQNLDAANTGVSKFGDIYGRVTNLNLLISRVTDATYIDEAKKNYYLAIAYGLRAFYYFDLYRVYGGVPLRYDVAVIDGELDPNKLYMARSKPSEVMASIKKDLDKSLELFGDENRFDPYGHGNKVYWSKAATECLMGEVYLWNAKVTIGDNAANPEDLTIAKRHLENVMNNYGLSKQADFASVFSSKANNEIIFAVRYVDGEATNDNGYWCYSINTGLTKDDGLREDTTAWNNPFGLTANRNQEFEYKPELFLSMDKKDARRDATFMGSYKRNNDDPSMLDLRGTHVCKNIGHINATKDRVFDGDYVIYRLPWVWLSLAEIANMQDDNPSVKKYINYVRERAYGDNWDESVYGYTPGDFTQNELAILHEKDKEFVQEGQRWWDVLRMTKTKGGEHLVFCVEGSIGSDQPILNKTTESHKVLWPLDKTILSNDPSLKQTPGYADAGQEEEVW